MKLNNRYINILTGVLERRLHIAPLVYINNTL